MLGSPEREPHRGLSGRGGLARGSGTLRPACASCSHNTITLRVPKPLISTRVWLLPEENSNATRRQGFKCPLTQHAGPRFCHISPSSGPAANSRSSAPSLCRPAGEGARAGQALVLVLLRAAAGTESVPRTDPLTRTGGAGPSSAGAAAARSWHQPREERGQAPQLPSLLRILRGFSAHPDPRSGDNGALWTARRTTALPGTDGSAVAGHRHPSDPADVLLPEHQHRVFNTLPPKRAGPGARGSRSFRGQAGQRAGGHGNTEGQAGPQPCGAGGARAEAAGHS